MAKQNNAINYIEFPLVDASGTQVFYAEAFGWSFQAWGHKYLSFSGAGIDGGFNGEDQTPVQRPGALVILYADDLSRTLRAVKAAGGEILRDIYAFPGGQRFHFADPNGNELAVWSESSE